MYLSSILADFFSEDGGKDRGRNVPTAAAKESQFVQCFVSEALEMMNKWH